MQLEFCKDHTDMDKTPREAVIARYYTRGVLQNMVHPSLNPTQPGPTPPDGLELPTLCCGGEGTPVP